MLIPKNGKKMVKIDWRKITLECLDILYKSLPLQTQAVFKLQIDNTK